MGRSLLAILLLAASIASGAAAALARTHALDAGRAATVMITGYRDGHGCTGAGVIIAFQANVLTILTAKHVADLSGLTIFTDDGAQLRNVEKIGIEGYDLAIVRAALPLDGPLRSGVRRDFAAVAGGSEIAYPAIAFGTATNAQAQIHVWGFTRNATTYVADGSVLSLNPQFPDGPANGRFAITCTACVPGMSGSGVFDDDGKLLGILSTGWKTAAGEVVMIEVEPLEPALGRLR